MSETRTYPSGAPMPQYESADPRRAGRARGSRLPDQARCPMTAVWIAVAGDLIAFGIVLAGAWWTRPGRDVDAEGSA